MSYSWQTLGKVDPEELKSSRLQIHYAIQYIAAVGAALVEPEVDDSQTAFNWNFELEAFVGNIVQTHTPFQIALDPVTLTLIVVDEQGYKILAFPLPEKTLDAGIQWLRKSVSLLGADSTKIHFVSHPEDFPDHQLAHGASFAPTKSPKLAELEQLARKELAAYYSNSTIIFQEIVKSFTGASPIHIWPHRFDLVTWISLPQSPYQEEQTYITMGMSPGDTMYEQPYWYVSPWPYPEIGDLPELEGEGFWLTEGWVGAILLASQVTNKDTEQAQQQQIRAFIDSAFAGSCSLLRGYSQL